MLVGAQPATDHHFVAFEGHRGMGFDAALLAHAPRDADRRDRRRRPTSCSAIATCLVSTASSP